MRARAKHARRSRDAESASERSERLTQGARKVTEEDMDMRDAESSREADSAAEDGRKEDATELRVTMTGREPRMRGTVGAAQACRNELAAMEVSEEGGVGAWKELMCAEAQRPPC